MTTLRRAWFTALLTAATSVLLVRTLALGPASRRAPLWAVLTTLALLVLQLLLDLLPALGTHLGVLQHDSLFGAARHLDALRHRGAGAATPRERRVRGVRFCLWLTGLAALVRVVGFPWAVPVFLAPYLRAETNLGWGRAIVVSAVTAALVQVVFMILLGVSFPPGLIG